MRRRTVDHEQEARKAQEEVEDVFRAKAMRMGRGGG